MKMLQSFLLFSVLFLLSCDLIDVSTPETPEKVTETPRLKEVSLFFVPHEGGVGEDDKPVLGGLISTKKFGEVYPQFPETIDLNYGTIRVQIVVGNSLIEKWNGSLELRKIDTNELLWETAFTKDNPFIFLPNVFLGETASVRITIYGIDSETVYEKYWFTLAVGM